MNHLANETSPYLLQHKDNPVDWHPWNESAFKKAKAENKPIFLSIGYAACHWCHVMAHESFENPLTAQILNQHYISIKVDREERPDIDQIYMSAVVALTGQGGWPLSVFLTPDLKPFYGGTYFPPIQRYGMPSFSEILLGINQTWKNEPDKVMQVAEQLTQHLQESQQILPEEINNTTIDITDYARAFLDRFDWQYGGWGEAPKFPAPMAIEFLLQCSKIQVSEISEMAYQTLQQMAQGGIYDLVDGGFHRYSTDATWTVPHFEKMLYDNAQLASVYTHAFQLTGNSLYRQIANGTLNYLLSQMQLPAGAFYSSQDADVGGSEGTYYLWNLDDLHGQAINDELLSKLHLPPNGHVDHQFLLKIRGKEKESSQNYADYQSFSLLEISPIIEVLKNIREQKQKPEMDDKIILSWNALAILAFLDAGLAFQNEKYINTAVRCTDFMIAHMIHGTDMDHSWRDGKGSGVGFLEDYASMIVVLFRVYQLTSDAKYYQLAQKLIDKMMENFSHESGLLQNAINQHNDLITNILDFGDMVTPSGFALATQASLMYSWFNPLDERNSKIQLWLKLVQDKVTKYPAAHACWLQQFLANQTPQISVIISHIGGCEKKIDFLRQTFYKKYRPNAAIFFAYNKNDNEIKHPAEILQDKILINNQLTLYYCENFTCQQPITDFDQMIDLLG
jgi:uncharacterized protein YyaL (SSP411 family)